MDIVDHGIFHILLCNSPKLGVNVFIALTPHHPRAILKIFIGIESFSLLKQFASQILPSAAETKACLQQDKLSELSPPCAGITAPATSQGPQVRHLLEDKKAKKDYVFFIHGVSEASTDKRNRKVCKIQYGEGLAYTVVTNRDVETLGEIE